MKDYWSELDINWAWEPFQPSADRPWNRQRATHLMRRAGFGGTPQEISSLLEQSPADAVQSLIIGQTQDDDFEQSANSLTQTILASGDPQRLSAAWVYRLLHTPNQLLEKMTLLWHGHFATSAAKVENAKLMWQQNQLLRENALGDFSLLVQGIARDPAMLIYLDSASNRKSHPNENFARELMELFCLGEGQYSEFDVQELARCFTGWEIRRDKFRKNPYQQDRGEKRLLGRIGQFDGEQAVEIVLEQPSMPLFVCRKLFHFFVCDEPAPPDDLLQPLAELFLASDLQLAPLVNRILSSNLFFSNFALSRKIRSPAEFAIGTLRTLQGTTNSIRLAKGLADIGQGLFYPPNVKGWDGGRAWINSSTLIGRANLAEQILNDDVTRFAGGSLESCLSQLEVAESQVLDFMETYLFAVSVSPSVRKQLAETLLQGKSLDDKRLRTTVHALMSLPEFQLC